MLLHSPKLIISEGIADLAANALFTSYQEQAEVSLQELCPDPPKESSIETLIAQSKVKGKLSLFWYNFAYHALIDEWNSEDLVQYATDFEIFNEESIKNQLNALSNSIYSTTVFSYNSGAKLIINKYGEFPSVKDFRNLLVNPILPSDLV